MKFRERRKLSENHGCQPCDLGNEMLAEIERLRVVLEEIAGLKGEDLHLADGCGFDNLAAWKASAALQEK